MSSLATLIKLQKNRVDEQRQQLAKLQATLDRIDQQIAEHEISKTREQLTATENPEARSTYGAFVKGAMIKSHALEKQRQVYVDAIEAARGVLSELFEEQKRYEIAEAARLEKLRKEEKRRETIQLDEIGGVTHERDKRE